tara:strand:+ start:508 stop:1191 length:684 start_codon:yes stop_codon:yes gene_type:complete
MGLSVMNFKPIFKFILTISIILVVGCANTPSVSNMHYIPKTKNKFERTKLRTSNNLMIEYSSEKSDSLSVFYKKGDIDELEYSLEYATYNISYFRNFDDHNYSFHLGVSAMEGVIVGYTLHPILYLQPHLWASTYLFGNHKAGLGMTASANEVFVIGYNLSFQQASATSCVGSCGLGAYKTPRDKYLLHRNIFELLGKFDSFQIGYKAEFDDSLAYHLSAINVGLVF